MPEQSRRFIVTGAAGGIGMAVAAAALREGNRVALLDRQLVAEVGDTDSLGASVEHRLDLGTDVSDAVEVETAFAAVSAEWGGIDVLVNCAGVAEPTPVINADIDTWDRIIATNLRGTFLCTRAALASMVPAGSGIIVNVASIDGLKGRAGGAAYCASKAGVVRFTESVADEVSRHSIRVNVVCPAGVDTPMWRRHHTNDRPETVLQPAEVAATILFLCSPQSSAANGSTIELLGPRLNWGTYL